MALTNKDSFVKTATAANRVQAIFVEALDWAERLGKTINTEQGLTNAIVCGFKIDELGQLYSAARRMEEVAALELPNDRTGPAEGCARIVEEAVAAAEYILDEIVTMAHA